MFRCLTCVKPFGTNTWLELIRRKSLTPQVGGSPVGVRFRPPVNRPKGYPPHVLLLAGARVVCWRPHVAGMRQYISCMQIKCTRIQMDPTFFFHITLYIIPFGFALPSPRHDIMTLPSAKQ